MTKPVCISCFLLFIGCSNPEKEAADHAARAEQLIAEDKLAEAILEYKNVLQTKPRDAAARRGLAIAYSRLGTHSDLQMARHHLEGAIDLDPLAVAPRIEMARLHIHFGDFGPARKQLVEALKTEPGNIEALTVSSTVNLALGRLEDAKEQLEKVLAEPAPSAEALLAYARYQLLAENQDQATDYAQQALKREPKMYAAFITLGDIAALQKDKASAEKHYRKALDNGKTEAEPYLKLGQFLVREKQWDDAIAVYQSLAEAKPKETAALIALGNIHLHLKQAEKAGPFFQKALELTPDSPVARDRLLLSSLAKGKLEDVRAELQKFTAEFGPQPLASYYEAELLRRAEGPDAALAVLQGIVKEHPKSGAPQVALAKLLAATGDLAGAKAALTVAMRQPQYYERALPVLVDILLDEGSSVRAVDESSRAYAKLPSSLTVALAHGKALIRAKNLEEANQVLTAAAQKHPARCGSPLLPGACAAGLG